MRERLRREPAARVERELAARAQLLEHVVVLLGPADGRAVGEVLRRAAQHRRAADVDHLDRLRLGHPAPRRDLLERIEVDADEVERLDPVLLERGDVVRLVAAGEDAGVDARVERLHAAAEHLRRGRDVLDARRPAGRSPRARPPCSRSPRAASRGSTSPRANVSRPVLSQVEISARIRVSRSRRLPAHRAPHHLGQQPVLDRLDPLVQRLASCRRRGRGRAPARAPGRCRRPRRRGARSRPISATPAASCSSTACAPGNAGSSDGWTLTTAPGKRSRKAGVSRCM